MNVFLDTGVYLSFFDVTNDDIGELRKILKLMDDNEIQVYVTEQVIDEFTRRRDGVVAKSISKLQSADITDVFPRLIQHYEEFDELHAATTEYKKAKKKIIDKAREQAIEHDLLADKLVKEIFEKSTILSVTPEIIEASRD